jgi:hypothetical protein
VGTAPHIHTRYDTNVHTHARAETPHAHARPHISSKAYRDHTDKNLDHRAAHGKRSRQSTRRTVGRHLSPTAPHCAALLVQHFRSIQARPVTAVQRNAHVAVFCSFSPSPSGPKITVSARLSFPLSGFRTTLQIVKLGWFPRRLLLSVAVSSDLVSKSLVELLNVSEGQRYSQVGTYEQPRSLPCPCISHGVPHHVHAQVPCACCLPISLLYTYTACIVHYLDHYCIIA